MKYYCIGIKGSGMATLAEILFDLGNEVSGYDDYKDYKFTEEGLNNRNIKIYYDSNHDVSDDTIVTYSKAFSINHPEIKRMKELGMKFISYNDLLGSLSSSFKTIGVCGTHGKTTTSTMLSHVLKNTKGCNYFIGDGSGYANKDNELFVLESCEFQKHFLSYKPTYAVVTNIELEHTECYKDINEIIDTFTIFSNKAKKVIACGDDLNVRKMKLESEVIYYGFNDNNDLIAKNIELTNLYSSFDVYYKGKFLEKFKIPVFGKHMILNALATICVCMMENIKISKIKQLLETFVNAKRRFKVRNINGTIIVDDYAHHPTEIKVTIQSARQKFPDKRIIAVFLPNTYSRTLALKADFIKELSKADKTFVMPIHCDREKKEDYENVSSDIIVKEIRNSELLTIDDVSKLLDYKNEVICFMSCANIYEIENKFIQLLEE